VFVDRILLKKICLITPDRNDRPEFLAHCRWQMERQTVGACAHFVMNAPAVEGLVDIVPRVRWGVDMARSLGYEYCFIIENDDYYPDDYIERMMEGLRWAAMVGTINTTTYILQQKCYRTTLHPGRSSLFLTGFKTKALERYTWPDDRMLYFDVHLWQHTCSKNFINFNGWGPVGIKHGVGFCPGNFHNGIVNGKPAKNMTEDSNSEWLRKHVRKESFEFYKKFIL
jgi:hypothetical protein